MAKHPVSRVSGTQEPQVEKAMTLTLILALTGELMILGLVWLNHLERRHP